MKLLIVYVSSKGNTVLVITAIIAGLASYWQKVVKVIDLLWQVIDKFVEKQEQAGDRADDDSDDDEEEEEDDDDDVERSDHGNSDNDDVKATSGADDVVKAVSGADNSTAAEQVRQQCVDDEGYEWSVNISSSESEDDTTVKGLHKPSVSQIYYV